MPIRSRQARVARGGVGAEHADLAGVGAAEALEDLDGRRLAGAVGPEEGEDLAALDRRGRRRARPRVLAVGLAQAADRDRGLAAGRGAAATAASSEFVSMQTGSRRRAAPVIGARVEPASPPAGGGRGAGSTRAPMTPGRVTRYLAA